MFTTYQIGMIKYKGKLLSSDENTTNILINKLVPMGPILISEKYNGENMSINNRFIISVREINE